MPFDAEYASLPDYILGITRRIWEGRGIGLIRRWYAEDCVMHLPLGDAAGVAAVVSGTLQTLHAFPDRRLLGEDVIHRDDGVGCGYSSHRIVSVMHHRGEAGFGPPGGQRVWVRTVADCLIRDGVIVEEWLVRDQSAMAMQLGLDPREWGANEAAAMAREGRTIPEPPTIGDAPLPDEPTAALFRRIFGEADLAAMRSGVHEAVNLHLPGGRSGFGHDDLDAWIIGLLAAFPDAQFAIDHVITRTDPGRGVRVALRTRLVGTHAGRGAFGPPSGARIAIPMILHAEIIDAVVTRLFVLMDELAVWTAIASRRG